MANPFTSTHSSGPTQGWETTGGPKMKSSAGYEATGGPKMPEQKIPAAKSNSYGGPKGKSVRERTPAPQYFKPTSGDKESM